MKIDRTKVRYWTEDLEEIYSRIDNQKGKPRSDKALKILGGVMIVLGFMMFIVSMIVFGNSPMSSGDFIRLIVFVLFGAVAANIGVFIMKKGGAK